MLHVSKPVEFEINFLLVEINVGCNINASTKENAPKLAISLCVTRSFTCREQSRVFRSHANAEDMCASFEFCSQWILVNVFAFERFVSEQICCTVSSKYKESMYY